MNPTLYDLTLEHLRAFLEERGERPYRADQVWRWAYRRLAASYEEMTDLPAPLRERLATDLPLTAPDVVGRLVSADALTRKSLLRLADGELVESVVMLYHPREDSRGRATVCISTQAGCAMGCVFCATGQAGFRRNLTAGEIVAQVVVAARQLAGDGRRLTNAVFMGMGEPLANYAATLAAVRALNQGFGMAARNITLSTIGLVPGIRRLAGEGLQVGLAVSLHAPDDLLRRRLIPTAGLPIEAILEACREYSGRTGRRVTFEYVLLAGINDAPGQAEALAARLRGLLCHVNLIPVNPTDAGDLQRPSRQRVVAFQRALQGHGVACTVRVEKGVEISAACGQLRGKTLQTADPLPLVTPG